MRFPLILSAVLLLASPLAMAGADAKCTCTKKCHMECQKGNQKACKCKHCACAKGGTCESGCSMKAKGDTEAPAPAGK